MCTPDSKNPNKLISTPYSKPCLDKQDIRAVTRVLRGTFLTQGPEIEKFEKEFAKFCGVKYAVACSSATAGLHISAMALGMGPGDLWWTSPNTFCATADAALRCGSDVDFVDIEWGTYNMDLALLEDRLKKAARRGRLPKVVAPVHFAGNPVDLEFLGELRRKFGFKVVEDAAHATGASLRGETVGSCRWSDLCVFSFHAVKIITTGEGGMVTTNSPELYKKLCRLRTHGITRDPKHRSRGRRHPWYYEKLELGNHYRMTDIQAALGRSQLTKVPRFQRERTKIAEDYSVRLAGLPLELPQLTPGAKSAWHLYPVAVVGGQGKRDQILRQLRTKGIFANLHYMPVPSLRLYRRVASKAAMDSCPIAKKYAERALSLPIFPGIKRSQESKVVQSLRKIISPSPGFRRFHE
jgi:UDP-4-amino-4,6-dideoxy-N-acetyl-beta-L-altrosamine transaminase